MYSKWFVSFKSSSYDSIIKNNVAWIDEGYFYFVQTSPTFGSANCSSHLECLPFSDFNPKVTTPFFFLGPISRECLSCHSLACMCFCMHPLFKDWFEVTLNWPSPWHLMSQLVTRVKQFWCTSQLSYLTRWSFWVEYSV